MKKMLALTLALVMALGLCACGGDTTDPAPEENPAAETVEIPPVEDLTSVDTSAIPGVEDGVLTVGMECAYAPYNWTQMDDSNGAVPISNVPGSYANGYDVMIAKRICEAYGWELEIVSSEWASLTPVYSPRPWTQHRRSVHDGGPNGRGRHGWPLLLCYHCLCDHQGQQVCQCQIHC